MLAQHEEKQIFLGINDILHNLEHVPTQDFAYFLVKYNSNLAEELAVALNNEIFDNFHGKYQE